MVTASIIAKETGGSRRHSRELVGAAMHRHSPFSMSGISERLFSLAFSNLVYPQIWEDPVVDMAALALEPGHRMVTIASGGCNWLSYLTAAPLDVVALDLNNSHIALNRLKLTAVRHLERYDDFYLLFGNARNARNVSIYDQRIAAHLDNATRRYWEAKDWRGRRRIEYLQHGLHKQGVLGRFIATGHGVARLLGGKPSAMMDARSLDDQKRIFEREIRPLFRTRVVRTLLSNKASLFGLGIPPAQYEALSEGRPMHEVVEERLERLACGFDLRDNYFAWQAFARGYKPEGDGPLPPYLLAANYEALRANSSQVAIVNANMITYLASEPDGSIDRYSLLDAQDWMDDSVLTALWSQITRTARPGARVIFRTAGVETILPGRLPQDILDRWTYCDADSHLLTHQDRSAIYGGFHYYVKAS